MEEWAVTEIRCEYAVNPLGLDTEKPRFSWKAACTRRGGQQSAYRILVADKEDDLRRTIGNIWDSGRIQDKASIGVPYAGEPLKPATRYWWKVMLWDEDGCPTPFSEAAWFETDLGRQGWQGEWIGAPEDLQGGPIFRREFTVKKPVASARCYVCGLGYYELHINGRKVGDHVLDPAFTDYDRRALYVTYDVGPQLSIGENVVGVMLGRGWYAQKHESFEKFTNRPLPWLSEPKLLLQLNLGYQDGTTESIVSQAGPEWRVCAGPIVDDGIYNGEIYDAGIECPGWDLPGCREQGWTNSVAVKAPKGELRPQLLEPIRVFRDILPVQLTHPRPGIHVYDMGQNFAGWARIKVEGPAGSSVTMKYAETLYDDGTVNQENLRAARASDTYILRGESEEIYEPRFTYHGFRYVQLEGFPGVPTRDSVVGRAVSSSVEDTAYFACSDTLINRLQQNIYWTERSNLMSIPTDCPQRDERQGWLNDLTARAEEAVYNFGMPQFFANYEDVIADTQDPETGFIKDTAPAAIYRFNEKDPVYACFVLIPILLLRHYGDSRTVERHYGHMKKWFEALKNSSEDYFLPQKSYADWAPPAIDCADPKDAGSSFTPAQLIGTGCFFYSATLLAQAARQLGKAEDMRYFERDAEQIGKALNDKYLDRAAHRYASGSQGAQVFPLFLGIVPKEVRAGVVKSLVRDIEAKDCHLSTGNQCTKYLFEVLCEEGYADLALQLAAQTSYPSWGYMISHGATTTWERWEYATGSEMNSHNHPMYSTIGAWFYKYLAGIRTGDCACGFDRIVIKPYVPRQLNFVEASLETVRGAVVSKWRKAENLFTLNVEIPFNATAVISLPKFDFSDKEVVIQESGRTVWADGTFKAGTDGIYSGTLEGARFIFEAGSGSYHFQVCRC